VPLHYLVKLEMLLAHVLRLRCFRETLEFIPPQLWLLDSPDLNPVVTVCGDTAREGVQKTHLDEMKPPVRTEWAKLDHVVITAAIRQWRR